MATQRVSPKTRRPAPRRQKSADIAAAPVYLAEIAAQERARRLLNYAVIGRLVELHTAKGSLLFPRNSGPGIGVHEDRDEFLFVTHWPELPELQEYSADLCPACLAECDICQGKGEALCIFTGCGGTGRRIVGYDGCPDCLKRGGIAPDCEACKGSGNVLILSDCPSCHGAGRASCGPCRGTGKRPTGKGGDGESTCPSCRGNLRGGKWERQDLQSLVAMRVGNWLAVGPVLRLVVDLPRGMSPQMPMRVIEFSAADRLMVLLRPDGGTPAYFWRAGGTEHGE